MKRLVAVILTFLLSTTIFSCVPSDKMQEPVFFSQIGDNTTEGKVDTGYFHDLYVDNNTLYIGGVPFPGSSSSGNSTHEHANLTTLDLISEAFTTSLKATYDSIVAIAHSHSNKTTLDQITEAFTTTLKATYDSLVSANHTHSNMTTLNNITEAFTTALKASYDAAVTASHGHSNLSILEATQQSFTTALKTSYDWLVTNITSSWKTTVDSAVALAHSHSNKSILDATQESFTTALENSYSWLVTNITSAWKTTVDNFIASKGQPSGLAPLDANSKVPTVNLGGAGADNTKYLRGDQTWQVPAGGTTVGYVVEAYAASQATTTDAQTLYWGSRLVAPSTTANRWRIYIPKAGTIKAVYIYSYAGTAGTGEAWSMSIRLNNTTDTLVQSLSANTNDRVWSNTGLSIAVAQGNYIEIKEVCPTWATNPATVTRSAVVYIE